MYNIDMWRNAMSRYRAARNVSCGANKTVISFGGTNRQLLRIGSVVVNNYPVTAVDIVTSQRNMLHGAVIRDGGGFSRNPLMCSWI